MELGGVHMRADPECLHGTGGGASQQDRVRRQLADRLLMADECVEGLRHDLQQRVLLALLGQRDPHRADRLRVPPVNDRALVAAERPDAVAGPEEREVCAGDLVQ
jgi:hypothetical protein